MSDHPSMIGGMSKSLFEITPLFAAALSLGVFGSVLYFVMKARVEKAGIPIKVFGTWRELLRLLRFYKELAPTKGWSLWPIAGFWISVAVMMVLALILGWTSTPHR
jgi:hypothetical protein